MSISGLALSTATSNSTAYIAQVFQAGCTGYAGCAAAGLQQVSGLFQLL
jgi:hypothetical protein